MKRYVRSALTIPELSVSLGNISQDDNKKVDDYTQEEIVKEAEYVLSCFNEPGHLLNECLHDPETRTDSRRQIRRLHEYINRYRETN